MSKEEIYNLFVFIEEKDIKSLGVVVYEADGTDDEKAAFLQARVNEDHAFAKCYPPEASLSVDQYEAKLRLGRHLDIFEGIFKEFEAPAKPLYVLTTVEDGVPRVLASIEHGPTTLSKLQGTPLGKEGPMIDYLEKYLNEDGFDLPRLINDDYFLAIKLLVNNGLYVSAAKLLMSCIDSIAFIDFGDVPGSFIKWLEAYANLNPLGITPQELWEFRNGIVHMTNLNSRAVLKGKAKALILSVGDLQRAPALDNASWKRLDFRELLVRIAEAVSKWAQTYNDDRDKFVDFVARYDLTISDSRLMVVTLDS